MLKHDATKREYELIGKIVDRAWDTVKHGYHERIDFWLDLEVTHSNGCPLDFERLLGFDNGSFYHDIIGIHNNINRTNGKLENCFVPRCASQTDGTAEDANEYIKADKRK
jgi:hypothetical protein